MMAKKIAMYQCGDGMLQTRAEVLEMLTEAYAGQRERIDLIKEWMNTARPGTTYRIGTPYGQLKCVEATELTPSKPLEESKPAAFHVSYEVTPHERGILCAALITQMRFLHAGGVTIEEAGATRARLRELYLRLGGDPAGLKPFDGII